MGESAGSLREARLMANRLVPVPGVAICLLTGLVLGAPAPKVPTSPDPDQATIAAFAKAGASYFRLVRDKDGEPGMESPRKAKGRGLPAFRFRQQGNAETLVRLPEVGVPFALELDATEAGERGLQRVVGFKKLQHLVV